MRDIYEKVEEYADSLGLSVWQLCNRAGENFNTVQNWKDEDPKTIQILNNLLTYRND